MNLLTISFYVLVGILALAILIAIIWTQVIKPDTSEDKLNKLTSYPLQKLKYVIKKLGRNNPNVFYNILLDDKNKNRRKNIYIPGIIISDQKIYLIASPVYSDKKIKLLKDKYIFIENKKEINLKYDVWFYKTTLYLSDYLNVSSEIFQLVIPTIKKTNNLKRIRKMSDLSSDEKFKKHSKISKVVYDKVLQLDIVNTKRRK